MDQCASRARKEVLMPSKVYDVPTIPPLATNWWALALRGVVAVLFGVATFLLPGFTLTYLVIMFGIFAFLDGVLSLVAALRAPRGQSRWWAMLFAGLAGIVAGVVAFINPGITALTLITFIGVYAIATGVAQIVAAIRLRKQITGEWLLVLSGAVSVLFGITLIGAPGLAAYALVLWLGAYAVMMGALLILLAFRIRSWTRQQGVQLQPA